MNQLGVIGTGNMATAIISGVTKSKLDVAICAYDVNTEKLLSLSQYNVKAMGSIKEVLAESKYLLLSVKPQNFTEVLAQIKGNINQDTVIISIAAGINKAFISGILEYDAKVIQVMPNTPLMIGYGASALCRCENITDVEFEFVKDIFNSAGITAAVPADKMNEIIAINGSSPAFIYEFARCFLEYGKSVDLDPNVCLSLFAQTLIGSAKMLTDSGHSVDELITMVSSKGGTTIAGLNAFKECNFEATIKTACEKCVERAYELAK